MAFTKDDVSRFRLVNGEKVPLSDTERQAIADEWNANEAADNAARRAKEVEEKRQAALASLQSSILASARNDPDAPQEVKEYFAEMEKVR